MKNILFIIYVVLAWVLSIVNTSGLGIAYDTPAKTNVLICLWCLILIAKKGGFSEAVRSSSRLVFFTILSFVILPLLTAGSWEGGSYLMMVPLVFCFSELKVTAWMMRISGYIVAGLGLFILFVYSRTEILSGWNDNHINMIGLFSYIYYSISLYGNMTGRKLTIGIAISFLYASILMSNDSRSAIVFIVLALLLAYSGEWFRWLIAKKKFVFWALNVPLIISLVCIFFPNLLIFEYFDRWSMEKFGKSALNGRDTLWIEAYERLFETYLIGEGEFLINHHNSAVAVVSVFGVIGYICWYKLFAKPVSFMRYYFRDNLMFGFISSFLLIFWQQSFELGFICASPNMIPYMILGLGIARAKDLNKRIQQRKKLQTQYSQQSEEQSVSQCIIH